MKRTLLVAGVSAALAVLATGCDSYPTEAEIDFDALESEEERAVARMIWVEFEETLETGWSFMLSTEVEAELEPVAAHLEELSDYLDTPGDGSKPELLYEGPESEALRAAHSEYLEVRRSIKAEREEEIEARREELSQELSSIDADLAETEEAIEAREAMLRDEVEAVSELEDEIEEAEQEFEDIRETVRQELNEAIEAEDLPINTLDHLRRYSWREWEKGPGEECPRPDSSLTVDARDSHGVCLFATPTPYRDPSPFDGGEGVNEVLDPILASRLLEAYEVTEELGPIGRNAPEDSLRGELRQARQTLSERQNEADSKHGSARDLNRKHSRSERERERVQGRLDGVERAEPNVQSFEVREEQQALQRSRREYRDALIRTTVEDHAQPAGEMTDEGTFPVEGKEGMVVAVMAAQDARASQSWEWSISLFTTPLEEEMADRNRVPIDPVEGEAGRAVFDEKDRDTMTREAYLVVGQELMD
ncbi:MULTISPECIES: hypothetical protein [Thioalkalivibrio]|uniref:Uncharacterized protein n=1 Tax=Thioalkalivibrio halophilus TaxID=252474 RepID=A0A1V3A0H0_9GAMM|nr:MULTISPECIES: hypothetical protein [Thioalkalivibrio]OOC10844.1 hypothetical protein B1A74_03170 [Thioalkalivibrio halophilus]